MQWRSEREAPQTLRGGNTVYTTRPKMTHIHVVFPRHQTTVYSNMYMYMDCVSAQEQNTSLNPKGCRDGSVKNQRNVRNTEDTILNRSTSTK